VFGQCILLGKVVHGDGGENEDLGMGCVLTVGSQFQVLSAGAGFIGSGGTG